MKLHQICSNIFMKHFKIHDKVMYFGEEMTILGFSNVMNFISEEKATTIELCSNYGNSDKVFMFMEHVQHDIKKI